MSRTSLGASRRGEETTFKLNGKVAIVTGAEVGSAALLQCRSPCRRGTSCALILSRNDEGDMVLKLYDLAAADPGRRFSPFCWRTKMALLHKEVEVETIPWRFADKDAIAFSGQGRVPVLVDGDRVVFDSWTIATYLEETYRDRPSLFGGAAGPAVSRFVNVWADTILVSGLLPLVVADIFAHLHEKDRAYFRETREKRLGATLEKVSANRETDVLAFRKALEPVRALLAAQPYFGGETPAYADYAVFGCFQWARCISAFHLLLKDDPVWAWRERLLSAFDGFARRATGYPV